jgi:hypothetical protein
MSIIDTINPLNILKTSKLNNDDLGKLLFGIDVKLEYRNILEIYNSQLFLLDLSMSEGFFDKKIYAYYLFGLIISQQLLLMKLIKEINTDKNIQYYKNTFPEWEVLINDLKDDVNNTLIRYLCYESLLKKIFDIKYDERDFNVIREKLVTFEELSELQVSQLLTWIIRPLFDGFFDLEIKNIFVMKCEDASCWIEKNISVKCKEASCENSLIKEFPIPLLMSKDQQDPQYKNHKQSIQDSIRPWVIYNTVVNKDKSGADHLTGVIGTIDSIISQLTGINKGYTIKAGKKAGEIANTAGDWYAQMRKEFRDLKNSLSNAYQGTTEGFSSFTTALTYGGLALGGYLVYDLFTSNNKD